MDGMISPVVPECAEAPIEWAPGGRSVRWLTDPFAFASAGQSFDPVHLSAQDETNLWQHTLSSSICCTGIGLHGGLTARLELHPAPAGSGLSFRRVDLGGPALPARFDTVAESRLCTVLGRDEGRIGTIEHLMAACVGAGIDNALVEVDGPELPILDGSADPFLFLIGCAGRTRQAAPRQMVVIRRSVTVRQGDAWAKLSPAGFATAPGLDMALSIDFPCKAIGRQSLRLRLTRAGFRDELACARTFTQAAEIEALRAAGLALGGSLDNAVVVDGDAVLNPGGLRMEREFVRHKLLDAVGDLALAGHGLHGRFEAHRTGHALNNRLLHALFADPANWSMAPVRDASTLRQAA